MRAQLTAIGLACATLLSACGGGGGGSAAMGAVVFETFDMRNGRNEMK